MTSALEKLPSLRRKHPYLRLAIVYGSVASETSRLDSDIDLGILAGAPLTDEQTIGLIEGVAQIAGRAVDLVDLCKVGEPLLGEILKHGKKLFGSSEDMARLMQRHVYANEDFVPYVRRLLEQRNRQWLHS